MATTGSDMTAAGKPRTKHRNQSRANDGFAVYLSLGGNRTLPRTLARLQELYGDKAPKHIRTVQAWSVDYGWVDAAIKHDEEVAAAEEKLRIQKEAKDRLRRSQAALDDADLIRAGGRELLFITPRDEFGHPLNVDSDGRAMGRGRVKGEFTPRELEVAASAMAKARELERIEHGLATQRTDITGQVIIRDYGPDTDIDQV